MAKIEIFTGDIAESGVKAVIRNTCLPGGEEDQKALEAVQTDLFVEGPDWNKENRMRAAELYQCCLLLLSEAKEKGLEELNIAGLSSGEYRSELFQAASQELRAVKEHSMKEELPRVVRFVCGKDEIANMYKTAYNYWLADDHDTRMDVPHHHEE